MDGVELVLFPGTEPAGAAGRLWDIDTGHDLMIAQPQAVAELLLRVASA